MSGLGLLLFDLQVFGISSVHWVQIEQYITTIFWISRCASTQPFFTQSLGRSGVLCPIRPTITSHQDSDVLQVLKDSVQVEGLG